MRIYDSAFYAIIFFLVGVLFSSFGLNFLTIILITSLTTVLFLCGAYFGKDSGKKLFWFSGLSLFIVVGSFYYFSYQAYQIESARIVFDKEIVFKGVVVKAAPQSNSQKLAVELASPLAGKISVQTRPFPKFNYGDLVEFKGIVKRPLPAFITSLSKDGILAVSEFTQIKLIAANQGNFIKSALFSFKEKIVKVFQKVLPGEQAAFLSGITLGERSEFSKEFKQEMSQSGTTHLVALSGYNISILVLVVAGALRYLFSRRICFWLTLAVIVGFVLMTGAEASVVRAAIMGSIVLLASQVNRAYSFRNIIAVAAFLMILANPKVLVFDVGFQLSFMALAGIVYFSPAIKKFFKIKDNNGFLSWKENLLTTLSAQIFVAPFLISYFGKFSLLSFIANVLILGAIPLTMALGFIIGGVGLVFCPLALVFGWFISIILSYEISIIKIFGNLNVFQFNHLSMSLTIIYYVLLIGFIVYADYISAIFKDSGNIKKVWGKISLASIIAIFKDSNNK
ncbi:ComEC/Rec2 family competence protein [Candidatus Wolfebacteria bacterium]|nr:ComEC/Rec2 family competence protein [Candidatus Wolfebacteria bacterium]